MNPITYTDCGTYTIYYRVIFTNYESVTGSATITIRMVDPAPVQTTTDLSKVYDGSPAVEPNYNTNTDGEATYTWYKKVNGQFEQVDSAIEVGEYKVVLTIGATQNYYETSTEVFFTISPKEIELGWDNTVLSYNGLPQYPTPYILASVKDDITITVVSNGDSIERGTYLATASIDNENYILLNTTKEYTIDYRLVEAPAEMTREYTGREIVVNVNTYYTASMPTLIEVGDYEITLSLNDKNNYQWVIRDETGEIVNRTTEDITSIVHITAADIHIAVAAPIKEQGYTGREIKPSVAITFYGITLLNGVDYELVYENNKNIGDDARVRILAKEGSNFTGEMILTFSIVQTTLRLTGESGYKFMMCQTQTSIVEDEHLIYNSSRRSLISGIEAKTTIADVLSNFILKESQTVIIYNANGIKVNASQYSKTFIGTGYRIQLKEGNITKDTVYTCVTGDLTGDGIIDSNDVTRLQRHLNRQNLLYNEYLLAADVDHNGVVNTNDLIALRSMAK